MANTAKKETYYSMVRATKLLPAVMIGGLGMMTSVLLILRMDEAPITPLGDFVVIGVALLAAVLTVLSSFLFRKQIGETVGKNLAEKLVIYRTAITVRFALMEGPGLLAAVLYFISGNYLFLVITGAMFLFMLLSRPTEELIAKQLMLTEADKQAIEQSKPL